MGVLKVYVAGQWIPINSIGTGATTSPLTTKGDIWVYGTIDTRLPVGTDNYVLTADSSETTGLKWAPATGGAGFTWNDRTGHPKCIHRHLPRSS